MKGSPLLRAMLAFLAIALAGVPLWKLTRAGDAVAAPAHVEKAAANITIRLTFSIPPKSFSISHLGAVVWTQTSPGTDAANILALAFPKEGVDLQIKVAWPTDAAAAARIRLSDPDGTEHDKTLWGRGDMEEVVTFP